MKGRDIKRKYKLLIYAVVVVSAALVFALIFYPYSRLISQMAIPEEARLPLLIFLALLPLSLLALLIVARKKRQ